jgi:hypothetical protein
MTEVFTRNKNYAPQHFCHWVIQIRITVTYIYTYVQTHTYIHMWVDPGLTFVVLVSSDRPRLFDYFQLNGC